MTNRILLYFLLATGLLGSMSCNSNNAPSNPPQATPTPSGPAYFASTDNTAGMPVTGEIDPTFTAGSFVPLSNGWVLLGDRTDSQVLLFNVIANSAAQTYQLPAVPNEMAYDPARTFLYVGMDNTNAVARINVATGAVTQIPLSLPVYYMALGPNGKVFCELNNAGYWNNYPVELVDGVNAVPLTTYNNLMQSVMAYCATTSQLIEPVDTAALTATSYNFSDSTNSLTAAQTVTGFSASNGMAVSPDGAHAAFIAQTQEVSDFDPADLTVSYGEWPSASCLVQTENFSPDSRYFVTVKGMIPTLVVYSVPTHALVKSLVMNTFDLRSNRAGFSKGGKIVYSLGYWNVINGPAIIDWMLLP